MMFNHLGKFDHDLNQRPKPIDDGLYIYGKSSPLMAELFRLVNDYDLPRYLSSGLKGAIRSYGYSYSLSNEELRSYKEFPNDILDNDIFGIIGKMNRCFCFL